MNFLLKIIANNSTRKLITPESIQIALLDKLYHITSPHFEFVMQKKPQSNFIYQHCADTPSAVLKKSGIHILPESMPEVNKRQKYSAITKKLEEQYENSFKKCSSPKEIFHLERKIKSEIRHKLSFIGCLDGKKYKHYLKFTPFMEILSQNTQRQYQKKGVKVDALGATIFPHGKVWMPTNQKYLQDYIKILSGLTNQQSSTFLDLGCGSGILSFLFAKQFKKAKIYGIDKNTDAVKTCNLNAAELGMGNVQAFEFDLKKQAKFQLETGEYKLPKKFDWIVINPPWIAASRMEGQSSLADAVYDDSNMFGNSLQLSKRLLAPDGKIIVIYSDLSEILGLSPKSFEQLCTSFGFLVLQKYEQPLAEQMVKKSAISEFKSRSKIVTYVLKKS